jgi:PhzF family phenazine biosynthesis protein
VTESNLDAVLRYTAFSLDPHGGNPAGIVLHAEGWSSDEMQRVAAAVGYSETVFVIGGDTSGLHVRYFSPAAEVTFCGHATIALGVALAERDGPRERVLNTLSGPVTVSTRSDEMGAMVATLTTVAPRVTEADQNDLKEAMSALGWRNADLHADLPPRVSYAGASHLILVAAQSSRLDRLEYEYDRLMRLMDRAGWTTIHLVWPSELPHRHSVRNAFPAGPVREDPATGAAAGAYGAYLRALGAVQPPIRLELTQGEKLGRRSTLFVDIPEGDGGIDVSGHAVSLDRVA